MDQTPGTKFGAAVVAGSLMTIVWWILGETIDLHPPMEVVNAAVVVLMAAGIFLAPERVAPRSVKEQLIREGWQPSAQDVGLLAGREGRR